MTKTKNVFWKNMWILTVGSIVFVGIFLEQYQWGIVSLFFTTPLILTSLRNPNYFSIPLSPRLKKIGYPILIIELIAWLLFSHGYDFLPHQNFYTFSFSVSQVLAFIFLLFFIEKSKNLSKGASNLSMVYLLIVLGINSILLFINYPRAGHSYFVEQTIKAKNLHKSKGGSYYYSIKFHNTEACINLMVDTTEAINMKIGSTIEFECRTGRLNYNGQIKHRLLDKMNQ